MLYGLPTICADVKDINIGNGILKLMLLLLKMTLLPVLKDFLKKMLLGRSQPAAIQNLMKNVELMTGAQPICAACKLMKLVLLKKKNVHHNLTTWLVSLGAVRDMTAQKMSGAQLMT